MRINAFITWEPVFQTLDTVCAGTTTALNKESNASSFFIDSELNYINVFSFVVKGSSINSSLDLLTDVEESFNIIDKDEVCYGLRLVTNQLTFTEPLFNLFKNYLPTGSRLILFKPKDMTPIVQWYKDYYDLLTAEFKTDRTAARNRKRLFCDSGSVLSHSQIETSLTAAQNEIEAEFSILGSSNYQNFDNSTLLSGTIPAESLYEARIISIP